MISIHGFIGLFDEDIKGKDTSDPYMTTEKNPLAPEPPTQEDLNRRRNLRKLSEDASMRGCPYNGHVYAGIMDNMRYKED